MSGESDLKMGGGRGGAAERLEERKGEIRSNIFKNDIFQYDIGARQNRRENSLITC